MSTKFGSVRRHDDRGCGNVPHGIVLGTDNNVWFTETYGNTSGQVGYLVI